MGAGAAAAARVRARRRPDRARVPSRPPEISVAPQGAARQRRVRAHLLGPGAGRGRSPAAARPRRAWQRGDPRCVALREPVGAARPGGGAAVPLHVRRLHGAVVEHVGGGRDLCRAHDLWRRGGLQERGARADRLRQLQADRHVGLEPGRRHLRHGHLPVSEAGEEAGRAHRLRRPAQDAVERRPGGRAHLHPALDRHRRADRHGLRDRQRRPAGPGLLRHPCARLRRGAFAARRTGRGLLSLVSPRAVGRHRQDARMGRGDHRHAGRDHSPAGDRIRHHQACRAPVRLRARPHRVRRAIPPRRLCALRHDRQCRHPRRQLGRQQRRHGANRYQEPADRRQSDRRPRGLAVARRSVGARQSRRLSGRHQAHLFGRRRPVQSMPRTSTRWWARSTASNSSWRKTIS